MKVLLVAHGLPPRGTGGTEIYTDGLARALARLPATSVHVLAREADPSRPELALREEARDGFGVTWLNHTFRDARSFADSYRHPGIARTVGRRLESLAPDVAHVQHLTGLGIDLLDELAQRRIPVVFTLNDYWLMCHRGQLLDLDRRRCNGPGASGCGRCAGPEALVDMLAASAHPPRLPRLPLPLATLARRIGRTLPAVRAASLRATRIRSDAVRRALRPVDILLSPSATLARRFIEFGIDPGRIRPTRQGIDLAPFVELAGAGPAARAPGAPLRAGFIGSLMESKAPHLLLEAAARLAPGKVDVHVFGGHADYHGDTSYQTKLAPLLRAPGVHWHGRIARERIALAFASIDVLVVPSVWLECAPFVIAEAFAAGVPVLASDLGGMAERVEHGVSGLTFEPGSSTALGAALTRLVEEPLLLATLRAGRPRVASLDEDATALRALYEERVAATPRPAAKSRLWAIVLNHATPSETVLAVRSLQASQRVPDSILMVDNGSGDGSAARLRSALPGVRLLESRQNLGFSGGMNLGIDAALAAGADSVLLLNSDAWLPPDALGRLESALHAGADLGIVAPLVLMRHDPFRIASAGMRFSARSGRMRQEGFRAARDREGDLGDDCAGLSGCALLVRRSVFETVGRLDPEYFFSFEDLDLCLRARARGFGIARVPGACVLHEGGATLPPSSPRRIYYATRNHLRLAAKLVPCPGPRGLARAAAIVLYNLAHVLLTAGVPRRAGVSALVRGVVDHARRRYGPAPDRDAASAA